MLTVETAVFDCNIVDLVPVVTEKVSLIWLNVVWNRWKSTVYSQGKVYKGELEKRNRNINTVYFINQARGNTRISHTEFVYDEIQL